MPAVFITNDMLQQWADQGKVRLDDTTLTLLSENRTVRLTPAVRFTKLIDDAGGDPHKLLGKVKTKDQLTELGAEHYLDSVIFGDVGYTVVEGFLGDLSPQKRAPATAGADPFAARETEVKLVRPSSPVPSSMMTPAAALPAVSLTPTSTPVHTPAAVELPPTPPAPAKTLTPTATPVVLPSLNPQTAEQLSEAEALSRLFLSTVKG